MGQKINPIGLRIGIVDTWRSNWFAKKDYDKFLHEDIKLRNFIMKKLGRQGVASVLIERSANCVVINIYSSRPGVIIGRKGEGVEKLKDQLQKITKTKVQINIEEVKEPESNAYLIAENIAAQLEKRISFRRALKQAIDRAMNTKECKGIKISVSGRLGGVEMARKESLSVGEMPLGTLRANIGYAYVPAFTTYGTIGVKVWIYKGKIFSLTKSPDSHG
jgi:small subunit ribosomal protein S3